MNTTENCIEPSQLTRFSYSGIQSPLGKGVEFNGYLKRCIEELNLNPYKVKRRLLDKGYTCSEGWPKREKQGIVTVTNFVNELINNDGESCLTVLKEFDYSSPNYLVPIGTHIGFFDVSSGRGSLFEMVLLEEFNLKYWNNSPDEGFGFQLQNYLWHTHNNQKSYRHLQK